MKALICSRLVLTLLDDFPGENPGRPLGFSRLIRYGFVGSLRGELKVKK